MKQRPLYGHRMAGRLIRASILVVAAMLAVPFFQALSNASAAIVMAADKAVSLYTDVNGNSKVNPGDTLEYEITIKNETGADINSASFTDTIDSNTTLVGGSVKTTPIARNDSGYSTVGNVQLTVTAAGVLANDSDPDGSSISITGVSGCADDTTPFVCAAASANGGDVTLNANGSFTYNPAPGYSGVDTFTYTVEDPDGNADSAVVSITVGTPVWFINNLATPPGDGRFTSPFSSIANFNSLAADEAGDYIFVYAGVGSYTGTITLLNNQQLFGQGVGLAVSPNLNISAGSRPTIANITLGSGNTVRGLNVSVTSGVGISGASVGTLTINNVAVTNTTGTGVSLNNGTLAVTLDSVFASNGTNGIVLNTTTGSFSVDNGLTTAGSGGTLSNMSQDGIRLNSATNVTIKNMNITTVATSDGLTCTATNATDCNAGVEILSSSNVILDNVDINGSGQAGISGNSVAGFQFKNGLITNIGNGPNENGVLFTGLSGTVRFEDSIIQNIEAGGIRFYNASGTLNMTLLRMTIQQNGAVNGLYGFDLHVEGTATANVLVDDGTFTSLRGDGIRGTALGSSVLNLTVNNTSQFTNNSGNGGVGMYSGGTSNVKVKIDGNTFQNTVGTPIYMLSEIDSVLQAIITNNTISHPSAPAPGQSGYGISLAQYDNSDMTALVQGNTISNTSLNALFIRSRDGNLPFTDGNFGTVHVDINQNTFNIPTTSSTSAVDIRAQNAENEICLSATNNTANGNFIAGIQARQLLTSVFKVEHISAPATWTNAQMAAYLNGVNIVNPSADTTTTFGSFTVVSMNTCRNAETPTLPAVSLSEGSVAQHMQPFAAPAASLDLASLKAQASAWVEEMASAFATRSAHASGEVVNLTLGTLNADQQVTITFRVTVDSPLSGTVTKVCNQGIAQYDAGFVPTNDPDTVDVSDATCIPLEDMTAPTTNIDSAPGNPDNDDTPTFTFSGEDNLSPANNLTFECQVDEGGWSACTTPYTTATLGEGEHTFEVRAVDEAGNTDATPASHTWVIDTTKPNVTVDEAAGQNDPTVISPVNFTVVFDEPVTGFDETDVDVSASTAAGASATVTEADPNDGTTYTVVISGMTSSGKVVVSIPADSASDAAGNLNNASTVIDDEVEFIVDVTNPDTTITAAPSNPTFSTDASFTFVGTDDHSAPSALTFECQLDGGGFAACISPHNYTGLGSGEHTFEVRATDEAGNVDDTPATHIWTIQEPPPPTNFLSNAKTDGWVLESSETSNKGGMKNNASTTLRLGDDALNRQYRSILSFNTSAIPDGANITKVTLLVKRASSSGGNLFKTFQGLMVDVRKGNFGKPALQLADFKGSAVGTYGPFKPVLQLDGWFTGWYEIDLTSGAAYINDAGNTQIRLRFKLDDNNNFTANFLSLHSGNAAAKNRPQLIVEYGTP